MIMGQDTIMERLLDAVLKLTDQVSEVKVAIVSEIGAVRKELRETHAELGSEISAINQTIQDDKPTVDTAAKFFKAWEKYKNYIFAIIMLAGLLGAGFYDLINSKFDDVRGITTLRKQVQSNSSDIKKNTSMLKQLLNFHKVKVDE